RTWPDMSLRERLGAMVVAVGLVTVAAGCTAKGAAANADSSTAASPSVDASAEGGSVTTAQDSGAIEDTAMPAMSGESLLLRMEHLLEAISQNNAELASDVLFPRDAYVSSKDVNDPQSAWDNKVRGAFRRSIERLHKRTKGVERAKFVSFELGHALVQITPKKKDFKKQLWRVKHSKLSFTIDGKLRHLDIAEMTAWRGDWYITRLR
ncbi:MAG TPA: hypothetical protein VM580_24315, partial [Labilithrix sp.]|nr:hypothetical protein [Labilithrix sp.]